MPSILDFLAHTRKRPQAPGMMSDANGITGTGPLTDSPDDPADVTPQPSSVQLPPRMPINRPMSDPQTSSAIPPTAFAGAGVTQGEHDPTINRIIQEGMTPPPTPAPGSVSGWRNALAAVATGIGGRTGAAFAPMIRYGNKGAQQEEEYNKWRSELPERIKLGELANADTNAQANIGYKNATLEANALNRQRLDQEKQDAQRTLQANEEDKFSKGGGQYIDPTVRGGAMNVPAQTIDTTPNSTLPPKVSVGPQPPKPFMSPAQFNSQPPQVETPQSMQLPGGAVAAQPGQVAPPSGYNRVPTPAYASQNGQRVQPTPAQVLKEKQDAENIPVGDEMAAELKMPKGTTVPPIVYPHLADTYIKKLAVKQPTEVGLALQSTIDAEHPQGDPVKALEVIKAQKLAERAPVSDVGTWTIAEDSQGNPVEHNTRTGEVRPVKGDIQKTGTKAKADAASQAGQDALNYATNYSKASPTGPGDEALLEKFFELAKPTTGFRMNQNQMSMLTNSRSWIDSAKAAGRHGLNGEWFDAKQRSQIIQTMKDLVASKGSSKQPAVTVTSPKDSRPPLSSFGN